MPAVFVTSEEPLLPIAQHRIKEFASLIGCSDPSKVTVVAKTDKIETGETLLRINVSYLENAHPDIKSFCNAVADFLKSELGADVDLDRKVVSH